MTSTDKRVEFNPPKGFALPEGTDSNEDFDLVCTFRMKNGKICMVKLGDMQMPGYDEKGKGKPDYSQLTKPIMDSQQAMAGQMGTGTDEGGY